MILNYLQIIEKGLGGLAVRHKSKLMQPMMDKLNSLYGVTSLHLIEIDLHER